MATQAAKNGASERSIMRQTGHRSVVMVRQYIREAELFCDNAAARLGDIKMIVKPGSTGIPGFILQGGIASAEKTLSASGLFLPFFRPGKFSKFFAPFWSAHYAPVSISR
jgi:hypothetical protein